MKELDSLRLKFTSSNNVPVTEARITDKEWDAVCKKIDDMQFEIDYLMLEWCEEEMTDEQYKEWGNALTSHPLTAGLRSV